MKRWALVPALVLASLAHAGVEPRRFAFRQELILPALEAHALYRARIPGAVFDGCERFPSDLRLFYEDGALCPHWIWKPAAKVTNHTVASTTLNESWIPENMCRRVDLVLRTEGDPPLRHNRLEIRTPGNAYLRRVEVFGRGDEREPWALLGRGWLFSDPASPARRNQIIRYPTSNLPHLQVLVYADARDATEIVAISSVRAIHHTRTGGHMEPVPLTSVPGAARASAEGVQTLEFDTGYRNRPVDRLTVNSTTPDFIRRVHVYGRHEPAQDWTWLGHGTVQRVQGTLQNTIDLNGTPSRYLRVQVFNHDNPPLQDLELKAEAVPHFLVFEPRSNQPLALYYGAAFMEPARYDLEARTRNRVDEARSADLGPRVENPAYAPAGYGPAGPWLAAAAVAVLSALVIWSIVGMLRRQQT